MVCIHTTAPAMFQRGRKQQTRVSILCNRHNSYRTKCQVKVLYIFLRVNVHIRLSLIHNINRSEKNHGRVHTLSILSNSSPVKRCRRKTQTRQRCHHDLDNRESEKKRTVITSPNRKSENLKKIK